VVALLVPELTVKDPTAAGAILERQFGFIPDSGLWRMGSQAVRLVAGDGAGHGRIDHLALAVPDLKATLADMLGRGAVLEPQVTPDGPGFIPEFWGKGLHYVYLRGPDGARIELCQRVQGGADTIGHDHIGIPCHDITAMQAFFTGQGAKLAASVDLTRPEGLIPVRFLAFADAMIELYSPPNPESAPMGLWSRLLVAGLPAPLTGPEGLILSPL
jgi:catechol 2,3-dioxygenase-like lactoylglutathione lyase family enzyme